MLIVTATWYLKNITSIFSIETQGGFLCVDHTLHISEYNDILIFVYILSVK